MSDLRWVEIDAWHLIESDFISRGSQPMVTTRCGITRAWSGVFLDRLPGGKEASCENCLKLLARDVDPVEEPAVTPKKRAKKSKS